MKLALRAAMAILAVGAAILGPEGARAAEPRASDLVRAELLAEPAAVTPGKPFTVGVRLTMKEHWHTYWRNPGDSGLATTIDWTLPDGWRAGDIAWPVPERIPVGPLANYGYDREVVLLTEITPSASASDKVATLAADVNYLVCERVCIPGEAKLSVVLPVAVPGASPAPSDDAPAIAAARETLPIASPWPSRIEVGPDTIRLKLEVAGARRGSIRDAYLFPFDETAIEHAAPQILSTGEDGLTLELKRSALSTTPPAGLGGVLVLDEQLDAGPGRAAFTIGEPPAATAAAADAAPRPQAVEITVAAVLQAAGLAFLGGLLLNLMPCVFPVLSIKVLSLVKHSGYGPRLVRWHGIAYAVGVVASFLGLACILLAVRAAGAEIGWGFQLQSPLVVALVAFLLFAMGLSLSGAAEFGTSLASLGGAPVRAGLGGSMLTGVLATVVATPCTAPFMGAAVGYAVAAPVPVSLAVFAALGVGLALPFVALTFWPGLVRRLPRPGSWMATLKQLLAFPLYATVAWLIFVLSQQVGPSGLFAALLGLVLVGFSVWAFGTAAGRVGGARRLAEAAVLAGLVGLAGAAYAVQLDGDPPATTVAGSDSEPFTQARLDALRSAGQPVFVNLTAAWCITCLVNERTTLAKAAVKEAFRARKVAYLKGDWTNRNPEISRLLEQNGRSGVPLYLLYPERGEPTILPQILTEGTVLDGLETIGATQRADLDPTSAKDQVR